MHDPTNDGREMMGEEAQLEAVGASPSVFRCEGEIAGRFGSGYTCRNFASIISRDGLGGALGEVEEICTIELRAKGYHKPADLEKGDAV